MPCLQVLAGSRQRAKAEPRRPKGIVGDDRERRVVGTLRQAQQRLPELACRVQLRPYHIKPPQTKQDREQLWGLAHLLTQRVGLGVGLLHLGRCVPFGHQQCRAEGNVQGQGLLGMLRRLWQGLQQLNPVVQVADGFQMGRAVAGSLARLLPVANRLLDETCLRVVMRQQFGLCLSGLWELGFQHLGNPLMVVLSRAL